MRSKAENLSHSLGGEWSYDGCTTWWCSDGTRHVSRCSAGVDEFDNEVGPPQYWLYTEGESPKRAERFLFEDSHWAKQFIEEWNGDMLKALCKKRFGK